MILKAAVIGDPIAQSKSPIIHGHWLKEYNIQAQFEAFLVPADKLAERCKTLIVDGYSGFSVTLPHKESIIPLCTSLDDAARAIGAVNCVVIKDDLLHGMNTDAYGFTANLGTADILGKKAFILGAGGATRAVIYALLQKGFRVTICNRTHHNAQLLAEEFDVKIVDWDARHDALTGVDLLVNCTSLGMQGKSALDLDLRALPKKAVVTDIVYNPLMTGLLSAAQARGNTVITGIGMLVHQAVPAFEAWFGVRPEVDDILMQKLIA